MDPSARVCPFCGDPPGDGVFCGACGRNLADVEQLPTRGEWEREKRGGGAPSRTEAEEAPDVAAFLAAMRAAGNPGTQTFPTPKPSAFRRAGKVEGWVARPVEREDFEQPKRYAPGLVLSVDGRFHRLDSELRGWGQRDFPHYHHTVSLEPVDPPTGPELAAALADLRRTGGVE